MKKLVKLTKVTKEEVEVEIEFPIYREHDVSGDSYSAVIYTRIEDGREVSIHKNERRGGVVEWQVEIEPFNTFSGEDFDYALGKGEYTSSEKDFNNVLAELRKFVGEL